MAQKLFVSLHYCAPKNITSEEWSKACKSTIASIHQSCDNLFRGVIEQWESTEPMFQRSSGSKDYSGIVGDETPDPLGLPGWKGIYGGSQRVIALVKLLSTFVTTGSNSTVNFPVGSVLDLASRITSVTVPSARDSDHSPVDSIFNPEVGQNERIELWSQLPAVHCAVVELLVSIKEMVGIGSVAISQSCLDQVIWVFETGNFNSELRIASYRAISALLPISGSVVTKHGISQIAPIVRSACSDLLPANPGSTSQDPTKATQPHQVLNNADTFLGTPQNTSNNDFSFFASYDVVETISKFLRDTIEFLPTQLLPASIRAEVDRTAILTRRDDIQLSSILNPVPAFKGARFTPTIVPFLARSHADNAGVEALLRPRMPVLMDVSRSSKWGNEEDKDEEVHEIEEPVSHTSRIADSNTCKETDAVYDPASLIERTTKAGYKRTYHGDLEDESEPVEPRPTQSTASQSKKPRVEPQFAASEHRGPAPIQYETAAQHQPLENPNSVPSYQEFQDTSIDKFDTNLERPNRQHGGIELPPSLTTNTRPANQQDEVQNEENSDEEIPHLNIEPDTDDDED